ncbi:MAG: STAS/SEC14 domain-containing protein [Deltaproteobacteria bacterium]|nr:STAS/SEC14 domain-containing protein [Deltaproteobacteria bacterium]
MLVSEIGSPSSCPADQAALVHFVTKATQRHSTIRLLVTPDDDWNDAGLRIPDDSVVAKAAFVGEPRWRDELYAFVAKPLRAIPTEYFGSEALARAWLDV